MKPIEQKWNTLKVLNYGVYRIFAKHIPRDLPIIGDAIHKLRRIIGRSLFMQSARIISIGKGVEFDNGCNIIMRDHANIGDYATLRGNYATITIGRHVMMGSHCAIICQNHFY